MRHTGAHAFLPAIADEVVKHVWVNGLVHVSNLARRDNRIGAVFYLDKGFSQVRAARIEGAPVAYPGWYVHGEYMARGTGSEFRRKCCGKCSQTA